MKGLRGSGTLLVSQCLVHHMPRAQSQNREALIGSKTFATFGISGELMDGDSSGESSENTASEAPETGRLRRMLRSHWPIRCLALLVLASLLLGVLFFYSRRAKPLPGEVVGQPKRRRSMPGLRPWRSTAVHCA